jgi:putative transposase
VHEHSRQTYRYLQVHAELCANGECVGKYRVARLMRQMGLQTKGRQRFRVTPQRDDQHRRAPNLLNGDFKTTRPNERWLCDITYIPIQGDWLYLAGIQDTFSRWIDG